MNLKLIMTGCFVKTLYLRCQFIRIWGSSSVFYSILTIWLLGLGSSIILKGPHVTAAICCWADSCLKCPSFVPHSIPFVHNSPSDLQHSTVMIFICICLQFGCFMRLFTKAHCTLVESSKQILASPSILMWFMGRFGGVTKAFNSYQINPVCLLNKHSHNKQTI